ncbi:hypothetical protein [Muriicola sp. Z0-33]|uniref:hypothetical protein n=1 Tax=Muriicola sp. Z0-33 TaxID=2816957 RepID=UPI002237F0E6|nr:hypothetical protein [Muriicola sp. Z0-33]MCW5515666.1 hypothetical protein [Muriicola sp. Z0-33]
MKSYLNLLKSDINKMTRQEHLYYWVIPITVLSILMIFYFSKIPALVEFVCPKENWEWGILENIQLVIIFCILIFAFRSFLKSEDSILKVGFLFISLFAVFVFLEEIDYGEHFAQFLGGEKEEFLSKYIPDKNIHNRGNNAKLFKRSVYLVMGLIFVIAPFLNSKFKHPYLKYLIPKPRIIIVAVLAIISDLVPRLLVGLNILEDGGLGVNIGEFSEIMVYYIFLIYLVQLIYIKQLKL